MTSTAIVLIIIALVAGLLLAWLFATFAFKAKKSTLEERASQQAARLQTAEAELAQERTLLTEAKQDKERLVAELATARADLKNLNEKLLHQQEELEQKFENLANKILDEKSKKFTEQNKEGIEQILKPLNEKIKDFEKKVEEGNKERIAQHASLREQLLGLKELNQTMSQEANNLTRALKGDKKLQGNWGELVLEQVLEKSGLEKNREYFTQQSFTNEEGRKQPDVIIHLPDGKRMVIDSKVSLVAYESMINAESDETEETAAKAHLLAVRNHIQNLSEKQYHTIYEMESPDFVLMFIPIETAFSAAINREPRLYNEAFDKNIVVVTPSTLLATLKTVDTLWQNEKQRKNTLEIARQAGALYDKFDGLLKDLEKVGNQLRTVQGSYELSMNKLTGKGNLIKRVEDLKALGIKANKQIEQKWLDRAEEDRVQDSPES